MKRTFRTYELAVEFYHQSQTLHLPRHLKDQLDRASSSVALNLAEGSGRSTPKDKKRFYHIALGSLRESQSILDLAQNTSPNLLNSADTLGAHLYRLIQNTRA